MRKIGIIIACLIVLIGGGIFTIVKLAIQRENSSALLFDNQVIIDEDRYISGSSSDDIIIDLDNGLRFFSGEILVFSNKLEPEVMADLIRPYQGEIIGYIKSFSFYQIKFANASNYDELKRLSDQLIQETDKIRSVHFNHPSDVGIISETVSINASDNNEWWHQAINTPQAWNEYRDRLETVKVGIKDDEFYLHKDLNFGTIPLSNPSSENLLSNHGTHVAGIIGANHTEGGVKGVATNTELYGLATRYLQHTEEIPNSAALNILTLEVLVLLKECKVINISMGAPLRQFAASHGNQVAIDEINRENELIANCLMLLLHPEMAGEDYPPRDYVICFSSGNTNDKVYIRTDNDSDAPFGYVEFTNKKEDKAIYKKYKDYKDRKETGNTYAHFDAYSGIDNTEIASRIIVVGAIEQDGGSYKVTDYTALGERVDIVAPGENILSTVYKKGTSDYDILSGTSMATPFVSGVAAMVWGLYPELTGDQVKEIIVDSASGRYSSTINNETHHYPMLDAKAALDKTQSWLEIGDTIIVAPTEDTTPKYPSLENMSEDDFNELYNEVWRFFRSPEAFYMIDDDYDTNVLRKILSISGFKCKLYLDYFGTEGIEWYSDATNGYSFLEFVDNIQPYDKAAVDPAGKYTFSHKDALYGVFDADKVDWLVTNIFNREPNYDAGGGYDLYYHEGKYYVAWLADGGVITKELEITKFEPMGDNKYHLKVDTVSEAGTESTYYLVMKRSFLEEINEYRWTYVDWSDVPLFITAPEKKDISIYSSLDEMDDKHYAELEYTAKRIFRPSNECVYDEANVLIYHLLDPGAYIYGGFYEEYFGGNGFEETLFSDSNLGDDPRNLFLHYARYDAEKIDWLLLNLFNIEATHKALEKSEYSNYAYYEDGFYYISWDQYSGSTIIATIEDFEHIEDNDYRLVASYTYFDMDGGSYDIHLRRKLGEDNKEYWSYIKISKIEKEVFILREDETVTLSGELGEVYREGLDYANWILILDEPCQLERKNGTITVDQVHVVAEYDLGEFVGEHVQVTGSVMEAQTAHHLRDVVLWNSTVEKK